MLLGGSSGGGRGGGWLPDEVEAEIRAARRKREASRG